MAKNKAQAVAIADHGGGSSSLTAATVREHVNLIQQVMQSVMKKDTHYGVIPGCKLPSLYKAGSEVLLTTFRIAVEPSVEDLSTPDCVHYRVHAAGKHQTSGIVIGTGVGECSSDEEKYKWRKAVSGAEFEAMPETRRRIKYGKDYTVQQVRTEPADVANTVLKMAKKRAQIDMTLTALAASDIFTQDIEDMPEELRSTAAATPSSAPVLTEAQQLVVSQWLVSIAACGTIDQCHATKDLIANDYGGLARIPPQLATAYNEKLKSLKKASEAQP